MVNYNKITYGKQNPSQLYKDELIWLNDKLLWKKKHILYKEWVNAELVYVRDILDENGQIKYEHISQSVINRSNFHVEINQIKSICSKIKVMSVMLPRKNIETHEYYQELIKEVKSTPSFLFWQERLKVVIDTNDVISKR